MTMGQLRQIFFITWLVVTAGAFVHGAMTSPATPYSALLLASMFLLFIPTVRIGRLQGETPLAGLGLAGPSIAYFLLGISAPVLLSLHAVPGIAASVGLVATYIWFERAARAALSAQAAHLHAARGDADFGIFTALTPMLGPPTSRPEPTSHPNHTQYDAAPLRDPMDGLTWRNRDAQTFTDQDRSP